LTSEKTRDNISELCLAKSCKKEMKKFLTTAGWMWYDIKVAAREKQKQLQKSWKKFL